MQFSRASCHSLDRGLRHEYLSVGPSHSNLMVILHNGSFVYSQMLPFSPRGFQPGDIFKAKEYELTGAAFGIPVFVLVLGIVVLLIGFLGCCGAWKLNKCFLRLLKCCGANGPSDWKNATKYCCPKGETNCTTTYFTQGCVDVIYDLLKNNLVGVAITVIVLGIIEIGAIVAAVFLAKKATEL
uniref:Tetraspanin n=1 Tax=Mesocestoides corti TaxID=53468 RepID=A0A5K3EFM4_MESCO